MGGGEACKGNGQESNSEHGDVKDGRVTNHGDYEQSGEGE